MGLCPCPCGPPVGARTMFGGVAAAADLPPRAFPPPDPIDPVQSPILIQRKILSVRTGPDGAVESKKQDFAMARLGFSQLYKSE